MQHATVQNPGRCYLQGPFGARWRVVYLAVDPYFAATSTVQTSEWPERPLRSCDRAFGADEAISLRALYYWA